MVRLLFVRKEGFRSEHGFGRQLRRTGAKNWTASAFDVYYEHLLLLSFWCDVKIEVSPPVRLV